MIYESPQSTLEGGNCKLKNSNATKLLIIGIGAVMAYSYMGPVGLILLGVVFMLAE